VVGVIISVTQADPAVTPTRMGNQSSDVSSKAFWPGETPLACVEVLGLSVVDRCIEEFRRAGIGEVCLLTDNALAPCSETDGGWAGVTSAVQQFKKDGTEWAFVMRSRAYVELDPLRMLHFHRNQRQVVTRAFDNKGPLDIWLMDTAAFSETEKALGIPGMPCAEYAVTGYVNRLRNAKDLRQLAVDGLTSRCRLRPRGTEVRPGVWVEEGAQIHKRARIVGPTFVGRGVKIREQCLITRCSNVESNSEIDYGTVVEDSSVLSNSYVGIGLDVSHSVVDGTILLNLERDVELEISDPGMIRRIKGSRKDSSRQSPVSLIAMTGGDFVPTEKEAG
jgi:hypothetical protein